jgi:osmotically-inducible protein OsmY
VRKLRSADAARFPRQVGGRTDAVESARPDHPRDRQPVEERSAVSADDGVVTLRGTVGSFREKREAKQDAQRVHGVKRVENEVEVRILTEDRRDDADLRGASSGH